MTPKNPDDFAVDTSNVTNLLNGLSGRFGNETAGHSGNDGTTADRHSGMTAPEPAPPAQQARRSKYTLLLNPEDALTVDELALHLRRRTGRRVEKSEILRALIRLADSKPAVLTSLGHALDR